MARGQGGANLPTAWPNRGVPNQRGIWHSLHAAHLQGGSKFAITLCKLFFKPETAYT